MKVKLFVLIIYCLFFNTSLLYANVSPNNRNESLEKMFYESGHKSVDDAVLEFEKHFNTDIELPVKLPPVAFSHVFGKCFIDSEYHINDQLRIEYIGDGRTTSAQNHYVIDIRPIAKKRKGIIRKNDIVRIYELESGTKAVYGTMFNEKINALVFERSGLQYWLWIDKRIEKKVPADSLVEIANSIGLENKYKYRKDIYG